MNDEPYGPPSAREMEEARRLAEALEGGNADFVDPEALAVARLLAALGQSPLDELASRRGAAQVARLAQKASRRRGLRKLLAPLAAAIVLAAGIAGRRPGGPTVSEELLASREAAARKALAALVSGPEELAEQRSRQLIGRLSSNRFDDLRRRRAAGVAGLGAAATTAAAGGHS